MAATALVQLPHRRAAQRQDVSRSSVSKRDRTEFHDALENALAAARDVLKEINGINEHRLWADKERQRRVLALFCVISNALAHVKQTSPEVLEQIHDAEVILRFGEVLQDPHRKIDIDSVWRAAIYGVPILIGALVAYAQSPLTSSFDRQVAALHSYACSLKAGWLNAEDVRNRMLYASMLVGAGWIADTIARSDQEELKRQITQQAQKHESLGLSDELAMTAASRFEALKQELRRGEPRGSA